MTSYYSWLQMIMAVAGKEPGHTYTPDPEPALDLLPKHVRDLLATGRGYVWGQSARSGQFEAIPPAQWRNIHIAIGAVPQTGRGKISFGAIARLGANDGWYDLCVEAADFGFLVHIIRHLFDSSETLNELMTIDDAALFLSVKLNGELEQERAWLISQIKEGEVDRYYAPPLTDWEAAFPHLKHWRVRRAQMLEIITERTAKIAGRTCMSADSEWPWIAYETAQVLVCRATGWAVDQARAWLQSRSVGASMQDWYPILRTRFDPCALAALEQKSDREKCRIANPAAVFDDFGEDADAVGNRPGCCAWYRPLRALLADGQTESGLSLNQVEWHAAELQTALEHELSANDAIEQAAAHAQPKKAAPAHRPARVETRGPKPKDFWPKVLGYAAGWLAEKGAAPDRQAELERIISDRIANQGSEAAPATVRGYAREMLEGYRQQLDDE